MPSSEPFSTTEATSAARPEALAAPTPDRRPDAHVTLACFEVGGQIYALEVAQLREIVRMQPITPLPNAPELIAGVVDLRGAVIPVVDLARCLGVARVEDGTRTRIVIVAHAGLALGLRVDAASDVLSLRSDRLEAVPALAVRPERPSVTHVVRREGEPLVMVLSVESVIENVSRSARTIGDGAGAIR